MMTTEVNCIVCTVNYIVCTKVNPSVGSAIFPPVILTPLSISDTPSLTLLHTLSSSHLDAYTPCFFFPTRPSLAVLTLLSTTSRPTFVSLSSPTQAANNPQLPLNMAYQAAMASAGALAALNLSSYSISLIIFANIPFKTMAWQIFTAAKALWSGARGLAPIYAACSAIALLQG